MFPESIVANAKIVILHEIGHVLGLVNLSFTKCHTPCNSSSQDTIYGESSGCNGASNEYDALGLGVGELKIESGSCGHWDESSFPTTFGASELMTPMFEVGLRQPISRVTLAALDEGATDYVIDYNAADSFSQFNSVSGDKTSEQANGLFEVLVPTSSFSLEGKMESLPLPETMNESFRRI